MIGLWDDGGSWFWDDWEISIDDWFGGGGGGGGGIKGPCKSYPFCGDQANVAGGATTTAPTAWHRSRCASPSRRRSTPTATGTVGRPGQAGELHGLHRRRLLGERGRDGRGRRDHVRRRRGPARDVVHDERLHAPEASICAFAELQFPDLSLPSYELCGNEIGFNFDLGSVGAEVCWDV